MFHIIFVLKKFIIKQRIQNSGGGKENMNKKIIVILVCMLLVTTIASATQTLRINSENEIAKAVEPKDGELNFLNLEGEITTVRLKFFVHPDFADKKGKDNISKMLKTLNDIFTKDFANEDHAQFDWNDSFVELTAGDFAGGYANRWNLRDNLKTRKNCSRGINIIIANSTYMPAGTLGSSPLNPGGIIIKDTCNDTEMAKMILAHELLHTLGLSHEQVKWYNKTSGKNESKPIPSTLKNSAGNPVGTKPKSKDVPPHGYGYYDKDGDCNLTEADGEWKSDNYEWDIDGDCRFATDKDKEYLLYGDEKAGTKISKEQMDEIIKNAKKIPNPRVDSASSSSEKKKISTSARQINDISDVIEYPSYIDIEKMGAILYWEYTYVPLLRLFMWVEDKVPEDYMVYYTFYLDIDGDISTGCPLTGADYAVDYGINVENPEGALWQYGLGDEMWTYVSELTGSIEQEYEDVFGTGLSEHEIPGLYILTVDVPLEYLYISYHGDMRIKGLASDFSDESPLSDEWYGFHTKFRSNNPI